jgi:hypothetical protein
MVLSRRVARSHERSTLEKAFLTGGEAFWIYQRRWHYLNRTACPNERLTFKEGSLTGEVDFIEMPKPRILPQRIGRSNEKPNTGVYFEEILMYCVVLHACTCHSSRFMRLCPFEVPIPQTPCSLGVGRSSPPRV